MKWADARKQFMYCDETNSLFKSPELVKEYGKEEAKIKLWLK